MTRALAFIATAVLVTIAAALLTACGGGGDDTEPPAADGHVTIGPPDCAHHPELCR